MPNWTLLDQCKMKYLSDIEMVDFVSATRNSIVQITELHQIDSSPTSADKSGQHRDANIEIMSKWHIYVGFTDVEIRYLFNIEWGGFGNRIPSYFCRFHIGCYIDLTYNVVDIKPVHFHLGFADTDVRYRWFISCPQRNCIVFISFDINRYIGPT